jgi:hypothetical protein
MTVMDYLEDARDLPNKGIFSCSTAIQMESIVWQKLYLQEILHKEAFNPTGTAIIAVPKTRARDVEQSIDDRPTTPPEQMIADDQSDPTTPRSDANKRMSTGSPPRAELDPLVIAAIKHYNLCGFCGGKEHKKYACPYRNKLPLALFGWKMRGVYDSPDTIHNGDVNNDGNSVLVKSVCFPNYHLRKKPKMLSEMAEAISEEQQLQRENIRELQALNPQVAISLIKCSRCLQEGHLGFECHSATGN